MDFKAYAKINLALDVLERRSDGYHEVRMLMQSIGLYDTVRIEAAAGNKIEVICDNRWIPEGMGNIAYKAAKLITETFSLDCGLKIEIVKRIPVAAGLAGGSADAAAVIQGLNRLLGLGLTLGKMMELGKRIGADVPFCLNGGTMLAEGIGERLTQVRPLKGVNILLVKPNIGVSTAWVYNNLVLDRVKYHPDIDFLINLIENFKIDTLAKNMVNVLETVTSTKYPVIGRIKQEMLSCGALGSIMSGSGPTVFGIFADRETASNALQALCKNSYECILTETTSGESDF